MRILIKQIKARNFKNHIELKLDLGMITRIYGGNGVGKSSVGEMVTWNLYGTDTMGNMLQKGLSPEPANRDFDRVEVHLLLDIDGKEIMVSRMIENGNLLYFINDVPKKATAFKEVVESLFDKQLFLALFNPLYFFTQKWEEQRVQLLQYVPQPTNKEVFKALSVLLVDRLEPLLKKKSLADLEAQHKDNKNRKDKDVLFLSGQVKVIRDDYKQAPSLEADPNELEKLNLELAAVEKELGEADAKEGAYARAVHAHEQLRSALLSVKEKADGVKEQYAKVKGTPVADSCHVCEQPFTEEAKHAALDHFNTSLIYIKESYNGLVAKHKELKAKMEAIVIPEAVDIDFSGLHTKRNDLENQINKLKDRAGLAAKLADAEKKEQEARDSHNESVLILEAIKAFKAVEAALMAEKIAGLFPTLTLELKQYNADGTDKPYFEVYQNGKPFRKLSKAESVKAGLELVDVLVKQSGIVAPLFLDNAESILKYKQPIGQLIECRVEDNPLHIKIEGV